MSVKSLHGYFSMVLFALGSMTLVITTKAAIVNKPTVVTSRTVLVDTTSNSSPKENVQEIKESLADIEKSPAEKNEETTHLNLNFGLREINDALAFLGVTDNTEEVGSNEMTTSATVHDISESSVLRDIEKYIAHLHDMNSNTDDVLYSRVKDVTEEQIAVDEVFDDVALASTANQDNPTDFSSLPEINLKNTTSKTPVLKSSVDTSEESITFWIVVGVTSSALLLLFVFVVIVVALYWRRSERRKLTLNKEFGRWDPQLLRPSKENINAFIFGSPIPSVSEMIKS